MLRTAALKYTAVMRMTWIQALEYKSNTIVGIFAIFTGILIEFLLWDRIYETRGLEVINGYTLNQLMVYIFFALMVGQLKSSWVTAFEMIECIRSGDMNKYLIRPVSYFFYNFMMFLGVNSLYYITYSLILILFLFIFPGLLFKTIISFLGFFLALILSIYLSYCIYFIMICFAFWFGEVRSLVISYNLAMLVLSGQYIPIRLFPNWAIQILDWTPIRYLIDFPVSIATGLLPKEEWLNGFIYSLIWCFILNLLCILIYRRGIKNYEAYGS